MATLNNPINPQNIVDRFADYVTATANQGIVWGTDVLPFPEFNSAEFGGTTAGRAILISGANIASVGFPIIATNIYNTLLSETITYTNIRKLNAILFVDGDGGNIGTRDTAGEIFNSTEVAHMNTGYRQGIGSPSASDVSVGNTSTSSGLETFFNNLRTAYNTARENIFTIQVNVCHASCHSSCHSSRGRR